MPENVIALTGSPGAQSVQATSALLDDLIQGVADGEVLAVLDEFLEHERETGVIGYAHPNGFRRINLVPVRGAVLRLHVWPAAGPHGDIHSHRWHFASLIVDGELQSREYGLGQLSSRPLYACTPEPAARRYSFELLAHVHPELAKTTVRGRGQSYGQPLELMHTAAAGPDGATTLILQGPTLRPSSFVVPFDDGEPIAEDLQRLPAVEIRSAVEKLRERLRLL